jgi:myo-inositol 2-dehydrogenase/D-chiro-inositol 1-dehydrogenase
VIALCVYNQGISYGYDQRLELHGSSGSLFVSNPLQSTASVVSKDRTSSDSPLFAGYATRYRDAYTQELRNLFNPQHRGWLVCFLF